MLLSTGLIQACFCAKIQKNIHQLQALHTIVIAHVSSSLRPYCLNVFWSQETLVINVSNAAVLSKIRQVCPTILYALQSKKIPASAVQARLYLVHETHKRIGPKPQKMTPAALEAFKKLELSIQEPLLKQAIHTLIATHHSV